MFLFLGGIVQIFWERMDLDHCSDFCFSTAIFPTSLFGLERRVYDKLQGADVMAMDYACHACDQSVKMVVRRSEFVIR